MSRGSAPAARGLRLSCALLVAAGLTGLLAGATQGAQTGRTTCSSFGPSWLRSYNARAPEDGNPLRILRACCKPGARFGVNACLVTITLAGTHDRGCESIEVNAAGVPVGAGRHERCAPAT